jgi:hypothetical protein
MTKQLLIVGMAGGLAVAIGLALVFSAISTQSTAQMMGGNMGIMGNQGMMATQSSNAPWQWNQRSIFNANGMSTADNVQITGVSVSGNKEVAVNLGYDGSETSPAVTVIAITNPMAMQGPMGMSSGMMGMGGMGMMQRGQNGMMYGSQAMTGGGWSAAPVWQNNTQWQQWHDQMAQFNNQMAQWHGQLNSTQWAQMQAWHNQMMTQGSTGPGTTWMNGTSTTWSGQLTEFQSQTGSSVLDGGWTSGATVTVKLEGDGSAYDGSGVRVMVFPLTS